MGTGFPGGRGQIDHGQKMVRERFATSNMLFVLDKIIKGIIRAFNKAFFTVASFLPIPGLQSVAGIFSKIIRMSLTFLDEVILSYVFRARTGNPWKLGQSALILYAQNYKAFLKNAVWLALITWVLVIVVFLIILAPVAGLVALFPESGGLLTFALTVIFAWGVKQAVIEPFAMTVLMQVFYRVTEGQQPNPEWEAKLDNVSGKFSQMKEKAAGWTEPEPKTELKSET